MNGQHMLEIMDALIGRILCNAKFDKPAVREMLAECGWTDDDLEYFNVKWMFEEDA